MSDLNPTANKVSSDDQASDMPSSSEPLSDEPPAWQTEALQEIESVIPDARKAELARMEDEWEQNRGANTKRSPFDREFLSRGDIMWLGYKARTKKGYAAPNAAADILAANKGELAIQGWTSVSGLNLAGAIFP